MGAEPGTVVVEEGDKDKKKNNNKRRSNRRSKQNSPLPVSVGGAGADSVNDGRGECSQLFGNGSRRANGHGNSVILSLLKRPMVDVPPPDGRGPALASDLAFSSVQTVLDERAELLPQEAGGEAFLKSCPEPVAGTGDPSGIFRTRGFPPSCQLEGGGSQVRMFAPHWSIDSANDAVEKGDAFKAMFRVNAHNRLEAYCKIEGVPVDILINGSAAQNRAVEGDMVVIQVDPFPCWTKMKGSNGPFNNTSASEDCSIAPQAKESTSVNMKGKSNVAVEDELTAMNGTWESTAVNGCSSSALYSSHIDSSENNVLVDNVKRLCALINSFPSKRPTGIVVTIVRKSPRREAIVGFLNVKQWFYYAQKNGASFSLEYGYIQQTPTDPRFPKMLVHVKDLPDDIKVRLQNGDATVEMELVATAIDDWGDECSFPRARIAHFLGRGREMDAHMNAILYENAILCSDFSAESLACLPRSGWEVPLEELKSRRDLRNLCIFTIDPPTATDLDDALSFERLPNSNIRIGVHIADASFFVSPGSALDIEAQKRSTTVYMPRKRIPMLPPLLSENLGSLNPGVDRLAFSIVWELNRYGYVLDRWIGRTVIRSCCKLSYDLAQDIIDGGPVDDFTSVKELPQLYGNFRWSDVFGCVRGLHEISKILREKRFHDGALRLDGSKVAFLLDDYGIPYDCMLSDRKVSTFLVEEFMLLANSTAAEVISRAFPDCALLRRHPEPNMRKLREFEAFCSRHGLELDTSSSGQFHKSLELIGEKLKDDRVLFDILISYATRPMQLAMYFCSGDLKDDREDWGHYALAVPLYTHFTAPLRRYPDIVVHRTLAAAVDAEALYIKLARMSHKVTEGKKLTKCFTGLHFDRDAAESSEGREVLSAAALKHCVPQGEKLSDVAAHCNERKLACRHVKDACDKLYMWMVLLRKEVLVSGARVLGLGPRFMSVYIHQLAIERRIYYDEVEGMMVEWLDNTSTLVLSFSKHKRSFRKAASGNQRTFGEVALLVNPCDLEVEPNAIKHNSHECGAESSENMSVRGQLMDTILKSETQPAMLPLTIPLLSTIPVALHAIGGDDGPLDIGVRLFISSYFG